jgi:hypothetical protein
MKPIDDGVPRSHGGHHHSQEEMHNVDVAHEHADIDIKAILGAAAGLAGITAIVFVLMAGLFRLLDSQARKNDPPVSPLAAQPTTMPRHVTGPAPFGAAPKPQLLTNEPAVLGQHRAGEDQQLSSYGWVNEQAGVARMPIAEAKKLLVERGIPARTGDSAIDPTLGTIRPATAESSSGRTADGPPRGAGLPPIGTPPSQPAPQPGHAPAQPGHTPGKPGGHE